VITMTVTVHSAAHARALPEIRGSLESHLTVACAGDEETQALARWAAARALHFTHIVLARGRARSQPMLTVRGDGAATQHPAATTRVAAELAAHGFRVVRVKTESAPWAEGVPQEDAEAITRHPGRYFEHHVKLLLPADHDRRRLEQTATAHGAHLSWNARRVRADGRQERFVTQRCHEVGRRTAERRMTALLAALDAAGHDVLETEREFVVHDSRLALDHGWITQEATR
jgi:hypothetical protein